MNRFQRVEDPDIAGELALPRPPASTTVTVFDLGPQLPVDVPTRPNPAATPAQQEDYETDVSHYVAKILQYRRERAEFTQKHGNGPIKIATDAVSAREMIDRGAGRYVLKLPAGLKLEV